MSDSALDEPGPTGKSSKLPLIIGLVLALVGAGAGFFAVHSGLLSFGESTSSEPAAVAALPDVGFVPVDPILMSLDTGQVLRFRAQLEVEGPHAEEVAGMMPRVVDVMNGYLRALEPADLNSPAILPKLRSQLLRRIQVVAGEGRVRDLLIMELVLS